MGESKAKEVREHKPSSVHKKLEVLGNILPSYLTREAVESGWTFIDLLPFPILLIAEDFEVLRSNRTATEVYGRSHGKCYEVSHGHKRPCDEAGEACPFREARESMRYVNVRHAHSTKEGIELFIVSAHPLETGEVLEIHFPVEDSLGRDGLTGLYSRDFFDQLACRQQALLGRMGLSFGVVLVDVDHFKNINDRFGHAVGDEVLKAVGASLRKTCRDGDSVGRYGGEEFCVFLPGADLAGSVAQGNRVLEAMRKLCIKTPEGEIEPRVSVGVWAGPASVEIADAIKLADDALYDAKKSGRDQLKISPEV